MIKKIECYIAVCDNCKDMYEDTDEQCVFTTEDSAKETIKSCDWIEDKTDGKIYCSECAKYDDSEDIVINLKRKRSSTNNKIK